jgi:hypothetical protein
MTTEMYRKVLNGPVLDQILKDTRNLMMPLLGRDPENWLGSNDAVEIKEQMKRNRSETHHTRVVRV